MIGMRASAFLLVAAIGAVAVPARADQKACVDAHQEAQRLRKSLDLLGARSRLVVCAGASCPSLVQKDCSDWLTDITHEIPSVIVSAKDEGGHELSDISVSVDGKLVAEKLDGKPIELNPGVYRFRYERPGAEPIEQSVMLQTGVANRVVEVTFPGGLAEKKKRVKTPVATWVLGGIGVAGFVSFAYFGLEARSEYKDKERECGSACDPNSTDSIRNKFTISDVSLVVSVLAFGGASYLYFTRPYEAVGSEKSATRTRVRVGATPRGGFASVTHDF